jgi:hypothetical protein
MDPGAAMMEERRQGGDTSGYQETE